MAAPLNHEKDPHWKNGAKILLRQTVQHLTSKPVQERPALMNAMLHNFDHAEWDHVPMAKEMNRNDPRTFQGMLYTARFLNEGKSPPS